MSCFFRHDWIYSEAEKVVGVEGSHEMVNKRRVCNRCGRTQENNGCFIDGGFENKWVTIGYSHNSEEESQ